MAPGDLALVAAAAGVALVPRPALPAATAPLALHPLAAPVTRTVSAAVRAGTTRRPDQRRVLDLPRGAAAAWSPAG
ncbi:hypothetical protein ACFO3J_10005 [Streptomyces polygonati]|uniref:Uncharacterized protein n=1 Tax=Streptomyces polygonati TaxID=1617087 RepID=A0ABV8HLR0_9ACTN